MLVRETTPEDVSSPTKIREKLVRETTPGDKKRSVSFLSLVTTFLLFRLNEQSLYGLCVVCCVCRQQDTTCDVVRDGMPSGPALLFAN